uniref:Taste receptor type 2 n=1 Tax=Scleropages formosus TaxID=113540 RepID=A0A8C9SYB2_SCLFO
MLSYVVLTVFSWSSTLVYLCRHMKRTRTSSSSFSSAALRRQLRVTMMGIIQAGLSVFFLIFTVLYGYYLFQNDQNFFLIESSHLLLSISTTVNLGLGQSLFRKRAADLFYKVRQTVGKLSIFYYTRIVPPRQAFFVWIKRKIKTIVYCGLILNTVFILVLSTANLPRMIHDMMNSFTENSLNTTNGLEVNPAVSWILQVSGGLYICFFSVTMALSWGATLVYLCRHMKRMQLSGSQSSSSRLRSQTRVTIMGIIQTALSFFFLFIAFLHWCYLYKYDRNNYVTVTMCSFFSTSTTVNLGLGQSVFRKRVANLFSKVFPSVRK